MIFVSASSGSSAIDLEQRRIGHQLALPIAAENRRQIEAETVDVIVVDPMPQAMEDHLADDRMVAVERVAAARVVAIRPAAVLQHVVDLIFQSLEAERRAVLVSFGGVVEHDVENHLDARPMQGQHRLLELADLAAGLAADGIAAMRREKRQRIVAPVVRPLARLAEPIVGRKLEDRHQLDRRHAQRLQIRNLLDQPEIRAAMLHVARLVAGEAADVHLVDHRLVQAAAQVAIALPVELVVDHDAFRRPNDAVRPPAETRRPGPWRTDRSAWRGRQTAVPCRDRRGRRPGDDKAGRGRCPARTRSRRRPSDSSRGSNGTTSAGSGSVGRVVEQHPHRRRRRLKTTNCTPPSCMIAPYGSGCVNRNVAKRSDIVALAPRS